VIHRFVLHESSSPVAKLHSQWQHSLPAPFALVAAYDHPIPYFLHHWIPLYLPAIIFRTHLLVFLAISSIVSLEELMTYSGYSVLPSAILVKGMARRNDTHFMTEGEGNYASFGILDWSCGTAIGADVVDDLKLEWKKHDMDQKAQQGADAGGNLIEGVGNKIKNATNGRKRSAAR
jgi:sterol desaturase/sphingolipid hydroxylase (fatty acid hydroxylase superfamily)